MGLFNFWKKDKAPVDREPKVKEFVFNTWTKPRVGDWYRYKIKARSRKEAFEKLILYFYGDNKDFNESDIKTDSGQTTWLGEEIFCDGMPLWFAKKIGGGGGKDAHKALLKYCIDNDIKLNK